MTDKSAAQIQYERFIAAMVDASPEERKHDVTDAPSWGEIPEYAREVIGRFLQVQAEGNTDDQGYGQVGYVAYVQSTGGLNYQGLPCPHWVDLPPAIKRAWGVAATAIRSEHEHRNASDYDLAFSHEELAELVAGLDAAQRTGTHTTEIAYPLRSRLRAILFPPEPELAPETVDDPPLLEEHGAELEGANDIEPPKLPVPAGSYDDYHAAVGAPENAAVGAVALDPLAGSEPKPTSAATEPPASERSDPATKTEPSPSGTPANGAPELPAVSEAPPGPGLPGLDPVIPGPPALPTNTEPPHGAEPEGKPDAPQTATAEQPADAGSDS